MNEYLLIVIISIGLAMDAFAISVVTGSVYKRLHIGHALRMALFFGGFQSLMPIIGYSAGSCFKNRIEAYDHWIAMGLLVIIGGKMIYEAIKIEEVDKNAKDPSNPAVLLALSLATSIDALAVGITLSLITSHVFEAVIIIGVVTFILSYIGWEVGKRLGRFFEGKIEILGGLILIGIGIKIFIGHVFFK